MDIECAGLRAEDLPVGEVIELGEHTVTRDEAIRFAAQWDPLPFHVDPEFARGTVFHDVIGSGRSRGQGISSSFPVVVRDSMSVWARAASASG